MPSPKKIRLKHDPQWRGILNIAGFALTLSFWPLILDRIAMLNCVPKEAGPGIKDFGYLIVAVATLTVAAIGAFAQHDKTKGQVAWLEKAHWPYLVGWFSGVAYVVLLVFSSPVLSPPLRALTNAANPQFQCASHSWQILSDLLSLRDYWYALVGAVLGALVAIQIDKRRSAASQRKKDKDARVALIGTIEDIVNLATQAANQFKTGQPNFPLGIQRASVLSDRISHFKDEKLRADIEGFIYQCSHYNATLTVVNSAYMTSLVTNNPAAAAILAPYSAMMINHLQLIINWAQPVIDKLKKEDA